MIIDSPIISGSHAASGSLNQHGDVVITGSLTVTGTINGSITGSITTASYALNAETLDGLDSTSFTTTSSFNTVSGSFSTRITDLESFSSSLDATFATDAQLTAVSQSFSSSLSTVSGSLASRVANNEATGSSLTTASSSFSTRVTNTEATASSLVTASGSFSTRTTNLETASGSFSTRTTNLETASGSFSTRTTNLETASGSFSTRVTSAEGSVTSLNSNTGSYATTGSNNFVNTQYISAANNAVSFTSTASLYTDGGLRVTKDMYVSGTSYFNNVTVYGTQSVQYITSSQLNISTNIISVNTDTPTIRFGGLAVYDSGSTGLSGSMLWDSEQNHWVYTNPSGSTYSGGMLISGPRASSLGTEQGTTSCMLLAGQGGDHLTSSMIYHSSTATCIPNTLIGGIACFSGQVCGNGATFTTTGNTAVTIASGVTGLSRLVFQGTVGNARGFVDYDNSTCGFIIRTNESTALTISNVGAAVFSNALQVAGQQAASNYGGTGLNFDFTSGNVGRIASVKTTSGGSSLEVHTYNTSGADVTALTISNTGAATFSSSVSAVSYVATGLLTGGLIAANTSFLDQTSSGIARWLSYGPDSTTRGGFNIFQASSTNALQNTVLAIGSTGVSCFSSTICAPTAIFSGCVGIGTTSPSVRLQVGNGTQTAINGADNKIHIATTDTRSSLLTLANSSGGTTVEGQFESSAETSDLKIIIGSTSNHDVTFRTNNIERARITATGISCFACQVCAPSFIGGTISGTTGTFSSSVNTSTFLRATGGTGATSGKGIEIGYEAGDFGTIIAYDRTTPGFKRLSLNDSLHITSTGNVGIGVTPSAWVGGIGRTALQVGITSVSINSSNDSFFGTNYYDDGTNNRYINTDFSLIYAQQNGSHIWYNAPSGTANCAITFTQAMTLNACGRLILGNTTDNTYSRLQVAGGAWIGQNAGRGLYFADGTSYTSVVGVNQAVTSYNAIELRASGTDGQLFLSTGGNVGIGTTSPSSTYGTLTVAGTGISIADDGNAKLQIGRYNASVCNAYIKMGTNACSLRFTNAADTVDVVVMEKGGNVGIGTSSPYQNLQVYQTGTAGNNYVEGTVQVGGTSSTLGAALSYAAQNSGYVNLTNLNTSGGANARINLGFGAISSGSPASTVMVLNQSGNIGIGTTSPQNRLTVNTPLRQDGETNSLGALVVAGPISDSPSNDFTNSTAIFRIQGCNATNNLQFGVGNNGYNFHPWIQGSFDNTPAGSPSFGCKDILLQPIGGNVGIGTTNPGYRLDVCTNASGDQVVARFQNSPGVGSEGAFIGFSTGYNAVSLIGARREGAENDASLIFSPMLNEVACERIRITSAGHLIPTSNGSQDLGSSACRWCTVYTSDLSLNNGIGNYTIVEGENDLFLYNNNSCKVYKFIVQEVCPEIAPAKRSI